MNRRFVILAWLTPLIVLHASTLAAGPLLDLRYKFDQGETTYSQLEIDTRTTTSGPSVAAKRRRAVTHTIVLESRVEDADAERGATIIYTMRALRVRLAEDSSKPIVHDSHARRPSERDLALRDLLGSSFSIVLDPTGAVSSATGLDALARAMTSHLASEGIEGQLAGALTKALTGDQLSRALVGGLRVLPDHPVSRGDTWSTDLDQPIPLIGLARSTWHHRLARIRKKGDSMLATIESEAEINLDSLPNALAGLIEIDADRIEGSATLIFDADHGQAISATVELVLPLTVSVPNLESLENERLEQLIRTRMVHEVIDERELPAPPS